MIERILDYQTVRFLLQVKMTEKMTCLVEDNQEFISVVCVKE